MKIVISGYYGFGNIGDEAVLVSMLQGFLRRDPALEITVLSASPRLTAEFNQVKSVHRFSLLEILRELIGTDVLVSGGGSLFQDATSTASLWYYSGLILLAKLLRKKVMVFAQGFGPVRKKINRLLARLVLGRADLITLRDEDSHAELKKLGVKRPPIQVTGDPAALLEVRSKNEGRKILGLEGIPLDNPLIGISVRSVPLQPQIEKELFRVLAEKLDRFVAKHKLQPVFFLFQCPEDMGEASQVIGAMKGKSHVVFRICRPQEMLELFAHLDILIGMRLHSLIFAALNSVPMLGMSYDPKVRSFAESIEQPCIRLDESGKIGIFWMESWCGKTRSKRN